LDIRLDIRLDIKRNVFMSSEKELNAPEMASIPPPNMPKQAI
jgi:hypothetical protein